MRKRLRKLSVILSAALLTAFLGGCGLFKLPTAEPVETTTPTATPSSALPGGSASGGDTIFSINFSSEHGLNPLSNLNKLNQLAASLVYEGLFTLDKSFDFHPVLCESWSTEDGLDYTFVIKSGVTFHDGTELTAYDAAYSLNQARKSSLYGGRFSNVSSIYAVDSRNLVITLSKANMLLPALLDAPIIKNGAVNERNPVGTGPYMLSQATGYNFLKAYEGWRGYSSLPAQRIYLQEYDAEELVGAFEGGYVDLVVTDPTDISSLSYSGNSEIRYFDTTFLQYLGFNMERGFFSNPEMRRVLNYIIDREYIKEKIMSGCGRAAYSPTLKSGDYLDSIAEGLAYSPDTAKEILESFGVKDYNKDGWVEYLSGGVAVRFTVTFVANRENFVKLAAAEHIAEGLKGLGINVDLQKLSWDDYVEALEKGNFDMYYAEVKLSADFDLSALLYKNGPLNYGGIKDEMYRVLFDAYLASDDEMRPAASEALYEDIAKTAPIIPIVFRRQMMLTRRGTVLGAEPSQSSVFYGIENWKIELS